MLKVIGVESLYYNVYSQEDKEYRIEKLNELSSANKVILNVEYIDASKHNEYYNTWENSSLNIVGYPADSDTALDELIIQGIETNIRMQREIMNDFGFCEGEQNIHYLEHRLEHLV